MEVLGKTADLRRVPGPVVLAIGVFDGVHLGHGEVVRAAITAATALGGTAVPLTFDPHPARVLKPEAAPRQLTCTEHKVDLIRRMGFGHVLVLPFSKQTAQTTPEDFILELSSHCNPLGAVCVGQNWNFGKDRKGNLPLLESFGAKLNFQAIGVPEFFIDGAAVSSTRIRSAVSSGDLATARNLLGREYTVWGTVVHGQKLGRSLGFPTANLRLCNEQLPPLGVYTVLVKENESSEPLHGVANLGCKPTVSGSHQPPTLEVHLLDKSGDFYDRIWEVQFVEFLRPEKRFSAVAQLKEQISVDVARARALFSKASADHLRRTKTR